VAYFTVPSQHSPAKCQGRIATNRHQDSQVGFQSFTCRTIPWFTLLWPQVAPENRACRSEVQKHMSDL